MLSEENSQDIGTDNDQIDQQTGSDDQIDYKTLYNQEVQNSKKQRAAKQKYESDLQKYQSAQKKKEEAAMVEQNKFKELWEADKKDAEWARTYKADRHAKLLHRLPEDKRNKFENLDLNSLEAVVEEFVTPANKEVLKPVHGTTKTTTINKPYDQMNDTERRQWVAEQVGSK